MYYSPGPAGDWTKPTDVPTPGKHRHQITAGRDHSSTAARPSSIRGGSGYYCRGGHITASRLYAGKLKEKLYNVLGFVQVLMATVQNNPS